MDECLRNVVRPGFLAMLAASTTLAGCAVGPDYRPSTPGDLGVPSAYSAGSTAAADPAELASWWKRFNDPVLDGLVDLAVSSNLDIAQSQARLRQAREASVQAGADLLPTARASGRAGRNIHSNGPDSSSYSLGIDADWQIDLFGGGRRAVEAARADEAASGYDLASVRIAIIAELVRN